MRVLEVETFGRGGLIHYAVNLSRALAERGHEVTLVTSVGYELEGRLDLPANVDLCKVTARFTQGSGTWGSGLLSGLVRKLEAMFDLFVVGALVRRRRPEVVHLHSTNPIALLHLGVWRLLRVPVAITAHVVTPHEPMRLQRAIFGRTYRLAHLVIAHSVFDRRRLIEELGVDPDRVAVIPHGEYGFFTDVAERSDSEAARRDLGLESDQEVALFFGFIREYKGLDVLLDAWPTVAEARPDARLMVAGDPGRLEPARRLELLERLRRAGAIHELSYIPFADVHRYFGATNVLVMPYRHVSQSGVLYLALSLGIPVVATRVGALPEVLRDDESALLVPPDAPAELAEALIRALGDSDLRKRLSRGGRRIAELHSWPAIAARTESALTRVAKIR